MAKEGDIHNNNPNNHLQLEDVVDYTSDYPPQESEVPDSPKTQRRGAIAGLILGNKKMCCLLVVIVGLVIAIVSVLAVGSSQDPVLFVPHQPLVLVDPSTLDPAVTGPLLTSLQNMYQRNGMDATPLDPKSADTTPQRRAFYWMAHENQKDLDHSTKMTRYALAVLYYSTNKVPTEHDEKPKTWYRATKWLTRASYCEWHGIVCDDNGHVEAIELDQNFLSGKLPLELQVLENSLYSIDITDNGVAMLEKDFDVFLHLNKLEEILADNNYLEYNDGLPSQLKSLTNLYLLDLSYNFLAGDLSSNDVLQSMKSLVHIELDANNFKGSIPAYIGQMTALEKLYLRRNNLNGDLTFLTSGKLRNLSVMWLDGNDLTGTIPPQIDTMQALESLSIYSTDLSGSIPVEIGNLLKLKRLWLYDNDLTGDIPVSLSKLSNLEVLELHDNKLKGSMPQGVCDTFASVQYQFKALTSDCKSVVSCNPNCCTTCY